MQCQVDVCKEVGFQRDRASTGGSVTIGAVMCRYEIVPKLSFVFFGITAVFTKSAHRSNQSISCDVYLSVCSLLETTLPSGLETSGQRAYC